MDFPDKYYQYKGQFEGFLNEVFDHLSLPQNSLSEAQKYSISSGKRLRPILFLSIFDGLSVQNKSVNLQSASIKEVVKLVSVAIEALHTYTLIHDDLPCLDNDDFRRGQPSCHKKFGEPIALLAGDALLNQSFELLFSAVKLYPELLFAAAEFAALTGAGGIIGGQFAELEIENQLKNNSIFATPALKNMLLDAYRGKTAALFEGAAVLGAAAAGADSTQIQNVRTFAKNFGLAFQLCDDLQDMDKKSFAYLFGKDQTLKLIKELSIQAYAAANSLKIPFLYSILDYLEAN